MAVQHLKQRGRVRLDHGVRVRQLAAAGLHRAVGDLDAEALVAEPQLDARREVAGARRGRTACAARAM